MATEKIKDFNSILDSFLLQISPLIGTTYHTFFKGLCKANCTVPLISSITILLPHRDQIMNKDESYFYDGNNYINSIKSVDTSKKNDDMSILSEIMRMTSIYDQLDEDSKENVWNILQALIQLTIEYCEIKNISF